MGKKKETPPVNNGDDNIKEERDEAGKEEGDRADINEGEVLEPDTAEEIPDLSKDEIAELIREKEEYNDRMLRTQADFDNYRKRIQKEHGNLLRYGSENTLREILPIVDNIELAVNSAREHDNSDSQLREGIELILTQFQSALEKLNVKPIESVGHPFDPNKHDALLRIHAPDASDGAVVEEIRKGYYLHDRVLRPAQVTVGTHEVQEEEGKE